MMDHAMDISFKIIVAGATTDTALSYRNSIGHARLLTFGNKRLSDEHIKAKIDKIVRSFV